MTVAHSTRDFHALGGLLASLPGVGVSYDVPLADRTTWRIGGPAALWVDLTAIRPDYANVVKVVEILQSSDIPFTVIGGGSNILGADKGYQGAVVRLAGDDSLCVFTDDSVHVSAEVTLSNLVRESARQGWSDLEFLTGIPGSVGGALAMNAGTGEQWIGSIVDSVTALVFHGDESDVDPQIKVFEGSELKWDYRDGSLRDKAIILDATLRLKSREEPDVVYGRISERLEKRRAGQPLDYPSAGSVFRNPDGDNAWRLVDAVGLKGKVQGGAQISTLHTNFIVNKGGATASDVMALIEEAQRRVFEEYDVRLQKEVRLLGSET